MRLKLYKFIVERISLPSNGKVIEVIYANKLSLKLKGLVTKEHFWIPMMKLAECTKLGILILLE